MTTVIRINFDNWVTGYHPSDVLGTDDDDKIQDLALELEESIQARLGDDYDFEFDSGFVCTLDDGSEWSIISDEITDEIETFVNNL